MPNLAETESVSKLAASILLSCKMVVVSNSYSKLSFLAPASMWTKSRFFSSALVKPLHHSCISLQHCHIHSVWSQIQMEVPFPASTCLGSFKTIDLSVYYAISFHHHILFSPLLALWTFIIWKAYFICCQTCMHQ